MNYESKFASSADQDPVVIDPSKIPEAELNRLCASLLRAVQDFYKIPENVRRFEEWRAQMKAEQ